MSDAPVSLSDDPTELKATIATLEAENARMRADVERMMATVRAHEALIQALRIRIARLQRQRFGASSEKIAHEIEQLELALEALEVAVSSTTNEAEDEAVEEAQPAAEVPPRRRRPKVSTTTSRERIVLDPGEACPDCGGALRLIGENVGEILELITARLKVIETARPKKSCRRCERITQAPAPSRPIPRSMAGPGLLAHVLVSKLTTTFPCIARTRSSPAWAPTSRPRRWWTGAARTCGCWRPWWIGSGPMSWPRTACMPMTHLFGCSIPPGASRVSARA